MGNARKIHARKQEVTLGELERQLDSYTQLATDIGEKASLVDCGLPLDRVVEETYQLILKAFHERNDLTLSESNGANAGLSLTAPPVGKTEPEKLTEPPVIPENLRVLVSAYGCSPDRGSEANVAWNIVRELSVRNELWVMTRAINKPVIEASGEPWISKVHWVYFDPPKGLTFWRRGKRGISLFYAWWQILARHQAKQLVAEHDFDVAHHITIGTYLFPSLISDLGVPTIFGPVGGGDQSPPGFERSFRWQGASEEGLRGLLRGGLQRFKLLNHYYLANAWTLAATPATERALRGMDVSPVTLMAQSASGGDKLERFIEKNPSPVRKWEAPLKLVTACRLVHWKAVDLALDAVSRARRDGLDVRLTVLEEGPERNHLIRTADELGLGDVVTFVGRKPTLEDVYDTIREADALIHPALHEAFGQAVLESLALGVPVICLDWGGPGLIVDDSCGYKVSPTTRKACVEDLADAITSLYADKESGRNFSEDCVARAMNYRWDLMAVEVNKLYREVLHREKSAGGNRM